VQGDAHFDFFSPVIVKVTSSRWAAATKTWANACREALRYGLIKGRRNRPKQRIATPSGVRPYWSRVSPPGLRAPGRSHVILVALTLAPESHHGQ
jgi:hypothetical protein